MKKLTKCLALTILLLCLIVLPGCTSQGEYKTYSSIYGEALKEYSGSEENLIVPKTFNDLDIKEIGSSCYAFNIYLTNVKIDSNIEAIRTCAFFYCTSIETIYIPSSVRLIEPYAFYKLKNLKRVYYEGSREEFLALFEEDDDNINSNKDLFLALIEYNYSYGD